MMRRINTVATLRALRSAGPLRLAGIMARTGLSRSTLEAVLDRLVADQLVEEMAAAGSAGRVGRPARTFRFNSACGHVVGLDIGPRHVSAAVADLTGAVVARRREPTSRSAGRSARLKTVRAAAQQALDQAGVAREHVRAVGVGSCGLVDAGVVTVCRVLPEWGGLHLAEELAPWFGCPVDVENDINLSAIGERWGGAAVGSDNLTWTSTSRTLAVGIVIAGQLYRGHDGAAGELGWIESLGWAEVRRHRLSYLGEPELAPSGAAEQVVDSALRGEADGVAAVAEFAGLLAPALAAVALAYNPEVLVVGGGIARAGDVILDPLRAALAPRCLHVPRLVCSALGDEAVAMGALRLALDRAEAELFAISAADASRPPTTLVSPDGADGARPVAAGGWSRPPLSER